MDNTIRPELNSFYSNFRVEDVTPLIENKNVFIKVYWIDTELMCYLWMPKAVFDENILKLQKGVIFSVDVNPVYTIVYNEHKLEHLVEQIAQTLLTNVDELHLKDLAESVRPHTTVAVSILKVKEILEKSDKFSVRKSGNNFYARRITC